MNKKRSDFLFSNGSFVIGMGSIIDLEGNYYEFNSSESSEEADLKALKNDFEVIGKDISDALNGINQSDKFLCHG